MTRAVDLFAGWGGFTLAALCNGVPSRVSTFPTLAAARKAWIWGEP